MNYKQQYTNIQIYQYNNTMQQTNLLWNSYDNIHKYLKMVKIGKIQTNKMVVFSFDKIVCATEKMDGSNLGIYIKKEEGEWTIVSLQGRNSEIWNEEKRAKQIKINQLSYGNAGALENLPNEMFSFAKLFASMLNVDEIMIYGEAFKLPNTTNNGTKQRFASWHPFGYKLDVLNPESCTYNLTSELHKLFTKISTVPSFRTHQETFNYLDNLTTHAVFPPTLLYCGSLKDTINDMYATMNESITNENTFEGMFIVAEDNATDSFAVKWKIGKYEEQQNIPTVDELFSTDTNADEESKEIYAKLECLYNASKLIKNENKTTTEKMPPIEDEMTIAITKAIDVEMSKMATIENAKQLSQNEKKTIASQLTQLVVIEVEKQYTDCEQKLPWEMKKVLVKTNGLILSRISKMQ